ncbi:MAG TPA: PIG-L deacetylase family protein [Rubrobacteraceae bacterium]
MADRVKSKYVIIVRQRSSGGFEDAGERKAEQMSEAGSGGRKLLIVGAHSGDFVWRAAGAISVATSRGGEARVVALSYGERGESGDLWDEPDQTVENVKRVRHEQSEEAARAIGARFECWDLGDYPLRVDEETVERLADEFRGFSPDVILTHTERDPFNPDHPVAHAAVLRARLLASGAGVASAFETIKPPELLYFEPHQPELCGFQPNTFVDITSVFERKLKAMEAMEAQKYMHKHYAERAKHRAFQARYATGDGEVRYAEAFQRAIPQVVRSL